MNKTLLHKLKEALLAVLPITVIILILNFSVVPMDRYQLYSFLIGAVFLILGMGLYSLGCDTSIEPIGGHIGAKITESKKIWLILAVCFVLGVIVTIAEPDLTVLATQVAGMIDKWELILTVAFGVGFFMVIYVLRTVLKINLNFVLIFFYGVLFLLAAFVDAGFVPLAFDSGGVTTGPITVPFIMALGVGISSVLGGKNSQDNSFGMIGVCSIGPIIAVLILGLIHDVSSFDYALSVPETFVGFGEVMAFYMKSLPHYLGEVAIALSPIVGFFVIFQIFVLKLPLKQLLKIIVGILYTYIGLSIFLTGVNVGFMPAGQYIGAELAKANRWLIIPIGMIVGACIVFAEPAVHVLNKQVEEITGGTINRSTMLMVLAASMACALGLSMLRVVTGISIWYIILPGYAIALTISFFVPKIFTAIAFDSGGVASGPMTATFLLPFAIGACSEISGTSAIMTDAFGIVALVAMTPLLTVQILGLVYKLHTAKATKVAAKQFKELLAEEGNVIELAEYNPEESVNSEKRGRLKTEIKRAEERVKRIVKQRKEKADKEKSDE